MYLTNTMSICLFAKYMNVNLKHFLFFYPRLLHDLLGKFPFSLLFVMEETDPRVRKVYWETNINVSQ